jgi:prophage regulatory protein
MTDILARLRIDAGHLTLAGLIQERALAADEIERLRRQVDELGERNASPQQRYDTQGIARPATIGTAQRSQVSKVHPSEQTTAHFDHDALLRLKDVCRLFGISRSTIYKRVSEESFPAPLRISERSVRWRMTDLADWSSGLNQRPKKGPKQGRI